MCSMMIAVLPDVSRLEQSLFALAPRPVDRALRERETVDLTVRGPDEVVAEQVDPERMRQQVGERVLQRLAHALERMSVVVVVVEEQRKDGAWTWLSVREAGSGIALDVSPMLCQPFAWGAGSAGWIWACTWCRVSP